VQITVLQGERELAAHNKVLAQLELAGLPPAKKGQLQIEITFELDLNGIVLLPMSFMSH
jgi:molecular chaperone DnaK